MKKDHCNYCDQELTDRFENLEIPEYITHYLVSGEPLQDLHFCHDVCREEFHKENCEPEMIETDNATYSECLDCGVVSQEPNL